MKKDTSDNIIDLNTLFNELNTLNESEQVYAITESASETLLKIDESAMDEVLAEWFYRLPKGYATHPYTNEELKVLDEVMQEYVSGNLNEEILKEASITDINNKNLLTQVSEQDKQEILNTEYMWLFDLPTAEYVPKPSPPFPNETP